MSRFCIVRGNIGTTALLFSKMVGAKGRVFVFEPVMYQTLRDNLRENKIENVEVIAAAVGDRDDQIEIHVSDFCLSALTRRRKSLPGEERPTNLS